MTRQYRRRYYDDDAITETPVEPTTAALLEKLDETDEAIATTLALEKQKTDWRLIDDDAKTGFDFLVRFADPDADTRLARWREGRYFNGRRWLHGGRWVAADTLMPLTEQPTEYLFTEPEQREEVVQNPPEAAPADVGAAPLIEALETAGSNLAEFFKE